MLSGNSAEHGAVAPCSAISCRAGRSQRPQRGRSGDEMMAVEWYRHGMKATIDKAGRLVIPRGLRAQVGLVHGGEVEIGVHGAAILIEPVAGDDLLKDGSFVVIPRSGKAVTDEDVQAQRLADQR